MRQHFICLSLLIIALSLINCQSGSESGIARQQQQQPTLPRATSATDNRAQATGTATPSSSGKAPTYTYEVVQSWPHDALAFTQGLVFADNGTLYESTGLYGQSSLRKDDLGTGQVLKTVSVASQYFAEGLTLFQGKLFQLTWKAHKGFIYDPNDFKLLGEFHYDGEGWGLTHDERFLILSDGTNKIRFLDPQNFKVVRTISVVENDMPLTNLNELEYIKGEIYANIWQTDMIVRLDPQSGKILGWIDLAGLLPANERTSTTDVLNGIAFNEATNQLIVTGKLWPKTFEIRLKSK
jgi:glutamine cyclotransferase